MKDFRLVAVAVYVTALAACGGADSAGNVSQTTQAVAPAAASNLVATVDSDSVRLTWSTSTDATSYHVKRATISGGPYTQIAAPASAAYTDTSVVSGTTYYYVVSAVDSVGESSNSPQVSATPMLPAQVPAAPANLAATAGNAAVNLTWTVSAGAAGYSVRRATTNGGPYTAIGTPTAISYADTGLTNGTTYYYVIVAVDAVGDSANSVQVSATPLLPAQVPAVPANLTATAGNATVKLTWTASAGATGYSVRRATTNNGPYTAIGTPTAASDVDTGLTNGTTYYYVVVAIDAVGDSANSAQVSATPVVSATLVPNGTYYFVNVNSGLVLGFNSGGAGTNLQQTSPTGGNGQLWKVAPLGGGLYSIINPASGLAMAAASGSGTPVDVATASGATTEQWVFTPTAGGSYTISPSYNTSLNLDITGASLSAGAALQIYTATGAANQRYQLVPSGNQATVIVNPSLPGLAVTDQILGMNMAYWYDQDNSAIVPAFKTAGIKAIRWPGGSGSDVYHWATNTLCQSGGPQTQESSAMFANFITDLVIPSGVDVAITADYGTNSACTGPGDPTEAANWVAAAKSNGNYVSHWTVGNEVYGTWETDLHTLPNDPATYASAVGTSTGTVGYYPQMKAQNPDTLVGVVVEPGTIAASGLAWDATVLSRASYDFVEYHFYAQGPGNESDAYLVGQAAQALTTQINSVKSDLAAAGHASTPIYLGELGSVYGDPGVQSSSITQALYAGQVLGELMNAGVSRATWWIGFGGCSTAGANGSPPNFSSALYGWQNFGGYMVFSDGLPEGGCTATPTVPAGTLLPTARAYQLFSAVAVDGEHVLSAPVAGDSADVRAYAATHSGGTVIVLFNTNETSSESVTIALAGLSTVSTATTQTYDKAIYDQSQNNVWAAPTTTSSSNTALPFTLMLTPWSMNVVILTP